MVSKLIGSLILASNFRLAAEPTPPEIQTSMQMCGSTNLASSISDIEKRVIAEGERHVRFEKKM